MGKTKKRVTKRGTRKNNMHVFSSTDFGSGDGMLTSVWGPALWHTLHTMSFNYPVSPTADDKKNYMGFLTHLKYVLPCKYCRANLRMNLKKLPLTMVRMKSRDAFSRYIYELHENVNAMLGKKSGLTYSDVCNRYEHFRARCNKITDDTSTKIHKKGCVIPFHKVKSKGVINIVPHDTKCESIQIDDKCFQVN